MMEAPVTAHRSKTLNNVASALFSAQLTLFAPGIYAVGLPDTGQSLCDNGANVMEACSSANTGDTTTMPRQDGRFGRDPTAGGTGFDYIKVCNSGELAGSGSCPADPAHGPGANEWGCTQDNITGLMWEIKTIDGTLRDMNWTYTWYDSDATANGGQPGCAENSSCPRTSDNCLDSSRCDSEKYLADVNSSLLCGYDNWRLPSKRELESLVHFGTTSPSIDAGLFPNSGSSIYWTSTTHAQNLANAWFVDFNNGFASNFDKSDSLYIRVVRGGAF